MDYIWDSFESDINARVTVLSVIDRFNYLRSLLEKSAAEVISGLTLTADNYKEAVSILKRFGNKHHNKAHGHTYFLVSNQ